MEQIFDTLDAALTAAFAEPAVLQPRRSSPYAEQSADPDRAEATVRGIFSAGPAEGALGGQAGGSGFSGTTRLASTSAEFWIAKAEVDALTALPAKGDTITFTSRVGSPIYAVSIVQQTDLGDLNLILVREDPPP